MKKNNEKQKLKYARQFERTAKNRSKRQAKHLARHPKDLQAVKKLNK